MKSIKSLISKTPKSVLPKLARKIDAGMKSKKSDIESIEKKQKMMKVAGMKKMKMC